MDPKTFTPQFRKNLQDIGQSLSSIITEDGKDILDEPWISQLRGVRDEINTTLAAMPPVDQVPAANEAHWGLMALHSSLLSIQNTVNYLRGALKAKTELIGKARASADAEFQKKVTDGEFLAKDVAAGMIEKARTEGDAAGLARGRTLGERRHSMTLCGLPGEVAATADDKLLLSEKADFDKAVTEAKTRWDKLTGLGVTQATSSVLGLPWAKEEDFTAQFDGLKSIHEAAKGKTHAGAPRVEKPNPMINPGGTPPVVPPAKEEKKSKPVFAM